MQINPEIIQTLERHNIEADEGLLYLLALFFDIKTDIIPEKTMKQVNFSRIIDRSYEDEQRNEVVWNLPLFIGVTATDAWSWIQDYRELFMGLRTNAGGSYSSCVEKMKKFFAANPDVRKEEVMEAADLYLEEFRYDTARLTYMQNAEYFISKMNRAAGTSAKSSRLEQYIEIARRNKKEGITEQNRFQSGLIKEEDL
jgi:hypothetical protein